MLRFELGATPVGSRRSYSQSKSPVTASKACALSPLPYTNITPSCTSGAVWFTPIGRAQLHFTRRSFTFERLIFLSGLNPYASYVRRHDSHSPSGGRVSIASVTGVILSSGFGRAGGGGSERPRVIPPPIG